tara:strand:- start:138 stop:611 length:474 start_codon:yes stop_codon:yes gene_type:complete
MAMKPTEEIMMMGKRADVPMGNPNAKREAPPEAMEAMAALMGNEAMLGSGMDRTMPEDSGMSMQQDAGALAEAVVGRTGGDVQQALMLLDDAKSMLEAASREPQRAAEGKALKPVPEDNKGLGKLPEDVRNKMGFMADGGGIMSAEEAMKELENFRS